MFWTNIKRRLTSVAVQLGQAKNPKISNTARSAYYRSAIILLCTVVEGMVYQLVKKHTAHNNHVIGSEVEYKPKHILPNSALGLTDTHVICKKITKDISIDDNGVTFDRLNQYLLSEHIILKSEYRHLNYVRNKRNRIHIQGLINSDTGYTAAIVKRISDAANILVNKLSTP